MQSALQDLLHAATFKFSTSIAGLAVSIVLAFAFRLYAIRIEASLGDFCEALESKLNYLSPQSLSVEIRDSLTAQLAQLKEINSEAFFARFGHEVAPSINTALTSALSPLTQEVRSAVEQLDHNSHEGVQDLVKQFSDKLRGGAGSELRELGGSLQAVLKAMETVRSDMGRSGEEFAAKLGDAAQNLNRVGVDAGDNLSRQSEISRQTLEQMLFSLRTIFDQANAQINTKSVVRCGWSHNNPCSIWDETDGAMGPKLSQSSYSASELKKQHRGDNTPANMTSQGIFWHYGAVRYRWQSQIADCLRKQRGLILEPSDYRVDR